MALVITSDANLSSAPLSERQCTVMNGMETESFAKRFGLLIKRKRGEQKLTQSDLADQAFGDIDKRSRISEYERGIHAPGTKQIASIAKALGISHEELERCQRGETPAIDEWHEVAGEFLPAAPLHFVGQEDAKATLERFITAQPANSLLVHGMGGVGKTALVVSVLTEMEGVARPPCFYLNVRGFEDVSDPESQTRAALTRLIRRYGAYEGKLPDDLTNMIALWKEQSCSVKELLILDNVSTQYQLKALTPIGKAQWIATSRRILHGADLHIPLNPLSEQSGSDLAISVCAESGYTLNNNHAAKLATLCDQLPLAIEVAASTIAITPGINVEKFLQRLGDARKEIALSDDWEAAVMARLKVSVDQLEPSIRNVWMLFGLFSGGFSEAAAQAIAPDTDIEAILADCSRRHLVSRQSNQVDKLSRYHLHDLLRAVALRLFDQLTEIEQKPYQQRFIGHFADLLSKTNDLVRIKRSTAIALEMENIRAALELALVSDEFEDLEYLVTLISNDDIEQIYPVDQLLSWVEASQEALAHKANVIGGERYDVATIKLIIKRACCLIDLSRLEDAEMVLKNALATPAAADRVASKATIYATLGRVLRQLPDRTEEALDAYAQAVDLEQQYPVPPGDQAATLNGYGNLLFQLGNLDSAWGAYETSLERNISASDSVGMAISFGNMANIAMERGDFEQAKTLAQAAEKIERDNEQWHALATTLHLLGRIAIMQGNGQESIGYYQEALGLHEKYNQVLMVTKSMGSIAAAYLQADDVENAQSYAKAAIRHAWKHDHMASAGGAIRALSGTYYAQNKLRSALKTIKYALRVHTASHQRTSVNEDMYVVAEIVVQMGNALKAIEYAEKAKSMAEEYGQKQLIARCDKLIQRLNSYPSGS